LGDAQLIRAAGNIKEKARILGLPKHHLEKFPTPVTVVDMYAGIGYFSFSYAKAGVDVVLCWVSAKQSAIDARV
jgi:tRNA G37 N-methylase Trm5